MQIFLEELEKMQKAASQEVLHITVKSFELSHAIIKTDLFSKVELKPVSRLILLTLSGMYNPKLGYSFPSVNKLAACTGYTDRQIKEGLKELSLSGLMVRTDKKIYFTKKFYKLLNLDQQDEEISKPSEKSSSKSEVSSPTCHEHVTKHEIKQKKEQNFSFKNLLDLAKTNTIAYHQEINNLSESEKEHLCKIKLNRTALTSFQKENIDKFIMLKDSEIAVINKKEPYFKQENIDIYYNSRMKKIREYQQEPQKQESISKNERSEVLAMLKVGYKAFSKNRSELINFLNRNKTKMQQFNITESQLAESI